MLELHLPHRVKLVIGVLYRHEEIYIRVRKNLKRRFGPIDFESMPLAFTYTDYYTREMGPGLIRRFFSFKKLIAPSSVVTIKLACVKIERALAIDKKRQINIDPGYVEGAKLVLTTTKDYSHRIYLGKGIFAEVTLQYRDHSWHELPSTFPDYRTPEYQSILEKIRQIYHEQLAETTRKRR